MAENNAVLTEAEKGRILYHLGYGLVNIADIFSLGVPAQGEPLYIAASSVNRIPVSRIHIVRELLSKLDVTEQQLLEAQERFAASSLGEITLNPDETRMLEEAYARWAQRLADVLICYVNPYSPRFLGGRRPMVVPVRPC